MDTNDVVRRVRYALSLDDADVVDILRPSAFEIRAEQVAAWRLKEGEEGFAVCPAPVLHALLDGLILQRRGARDGDEATTDKTKPVQPVSDDTVDNNAVLKQLRVALSLKTDEVHALIGQGGGKLTKSEVNALFRKPDARNFRRCGDQVLRWFLAGLASKRNTAS